MPSRKIRYKVLKVVYGKGDEPFRASLKLPGGEIIQGHSNIEHLLLSLHVQNEKGMTLLPCKITFEFRDEKQFYFG